MNSACLAASTGPSALGPHCDALCVIGFMVWIFSTETSNGTRWVMNSTGRLDNLYEAVLKNVISFSLVFIILCINGAFVFAYFKNQDFQRDPRYVLYVHLVMNDMIMLAGSLVLQIASYVSALSRTSCCLLLLVLLTANK
ncbi:hypothetical protein EYF80_064391 [Liparis tanakae]|uniref:Uncharacterized protein n=1 Tax=Liparis tanakae TaxID=230148 RepID=A0A4Z2E9J2_9TELE|nr:hypothetical protein EYF80_064391 [Liparis tanakae]